MTAKKNYTTFCILFILLVCFSCKQSNNHPPPAKDGYLDLSDWDFEKKGVVTLDGTWEFYWNKLYTPQDFKRDSLLPKTGYIKFPSDWDKEVISGNRFPAKGYATYRLKIKLNKATDILAIKIFDASSAYKLWINDKLVASNGRVDSVPGQMKAQYLPMVRSFDADTEKLDLIIQVSNNFHSKGGFWTSIELGTQEQLTSKRDFKAFYRLILSGVFFFLFIYHLWIYFLRKREKASLWFGLLCLSLLVRDLLTGDRFFYVIFPDFDLNIGYRLEYLPLIIGPTLNAIFTAYLFPQEFPKKLLRIILWVTAVETIIILFTTTSFYTNQLLWFELTLVIKFIITIIIIIRGIIHKRLGAIPFLLSMLILIASAVRDITFSALGIYTADIIPLAFFISVLAQTYVLAYRMTFAFTEVEDLSANLEKKVEDRTRELSEEKKKSDELLLNILPVEVAEELKNKGHADAQLMDQVTVLFTDFKGFTAISEKMSAKELVDDLHKYFSAFDRICEKYGIEKIKTIGDAYMAAGGLPTPNTSHAEDVVKAALEMVQEIENGKAQKIAQGLPYFEIRIGVHTGPVVAGIVGVKKFAYDIWGDTVNTASRMESSGDVGKVNISGITYELVKDKFKCNHRGKIKAKGKGELDMYFVERMP